jgi:hypothetical protein
MYKVGDLLGFRGEVREVRPIGMVIRTISPPRQRDGCSAEVKWVMGNPFVTSEPVTNLESFFIRDGSMEIISDVR